MTFTSPHIENFEGHGFHEIVITKIYTSFWASPVVQSKETAMQETQETWVQFLGLKDPLEEEMATRSSILA